MNGEKAIVKAEAPTNIIGMAESFRLAEAISKSTIIPREFQGNPSNVLIAIEMAHRINASVLAVMQSLYIVHSKPSWSGQFIIGIINNSRRFQHELRFEFSDDGSECEAYTLGLDGTKLVGPKASIAMAKAEGWFANNKKWTTMPQLMLRYRSGTFFGRTYCPDLLLGMKEEFEIVEADAVEIKRPEIPTTTKDMLHEATVGDSRSAEPGLEPNQEPAVSPPPEAPKPPTRKKKLQVKEPPKTNDSHSEAPAPAAAPKTTFRQQLKERIALGNFTLDDFLRLANYQEWWGKKGLTYATVDQVPDEKFAVFLTEDEWPTVMDQLEKTVSYL